MKSNQSTTIVLLLIVSAVLGPLVLVIDNLTVRIILIGIQLVCLFLIGMNLRPLPPNPPTVPPVK